MPLIYIIILIAALVGLKFPDCDLVLLFPIRHRSVWTHGPLPALIVIYLDGRFPAYHYAWMAFLAGLAIHLFADLFPVRWTGAALINLKPLKNVTLKPMQSFGVIFSGSALSAYLCWMRL
jgi:membrane-bound metal-dependent hydrolase YbcI (DUF457 family)